MSLKTRISGIFRPHFSDGVGTEAVTFTALLRSAAIIRISYASFQSGFWRAYALMSLVPGGMRDAGKHVPFSAVGTSHAGFGERVMVYAAM